MPKKHHCYAQQMWLLLSLMGGGRNRFSLHDRFKLVLGQLRATNVLFIFVDLERKGMTSYEPMILGRFRTTVKAAILA